MRCDTGDEPREGGSGFSSLLTELASSSSSSSSLSLSASDLVASASGGGG